MNDINVKGRGLLENKMNDINEEIYIHNNIARKICGLVLVETSSLHEPLYVTNSFARIPNLFA